MLTLGRIREHGDALRRCYPFDTPETGRGQQIAGVLAVAAAGAGMAHDHTLRACLRALLGITRAECASLEWYGDADSLRDAARLRVVARRLAADLESLAGR